ncbi:zinc finger MYM-type protein 1-like [Daphnia magna]|nr:zinc finger MYM-type protein 1-like [Daphnia magna]
MNTESKNKRASGAKRRKESAIKKKKVEQFLTEVPKLSVFFRPISASSQNSSENEIACVPLDCTVGEILSTNNDVSLPNSPSSFEQSPDTQELETGHAAHADFSVKPVCSSVDLQITDETSTLTLFSEDPANWDRENENLIEHLILNPPKSNSNLICRSSSSTSSKFGNVDDTEKRESWKNQHQCMKEHEQSTDRRFAVTSLVNRSGTKSRIDAELVKEFLNEREGLAFRGSNQTLGLPQNGNYLGALELLSEYDAFLAKHLQTHGNKGKGKTSYLSANLCEEFVELLAKSVLEFMVAELKQAKYYSTILDSTPDISHVDQLTFVIRYVLEDGTPVERFFGFFPISGHTATEMEKFLLEQLEKHDIKIEDCRGQSYDNASNMSGQYNGLQAKIKKRNPLAEYVPCAGHSLNLIGSSAAEACSASLDFFGFLQSIYNFFAASTHRWAILKKYLKKDLRVPKSLSQTRWSARADACVALKEGYKAFQAALNEIAADRCQPPSARNEASGLASKFDQLEIGVLTVVWSVVMERFNKTNKLLQTVNIDLGTVVDLYTSLTNFVQEVRSNFTKYETEAKLMSTEVYEADKRRKRTRKRHHDEIEN